MFLEYSLKEIKKASSFIIKNSNTNCLLFKGEMGVGKTTLIKQICYDLGCNENVNSPTFSLINEYKSDTKSILHMDLFRLKNKNEVFDLGVIDYLDSKDIIIIEWPEILIKHVDISHTLIELTVKNFDLRKIQLKNENL